MEGNPESSNSTRYGMLSASNIIRSPLSTLLEYSGILRFNHHHHHHNPNNTDPLSDQIHNDGGEVSIRIIGPSESDHHHHQHHIRREEEPPPPHPQRDSGVAPQNANVNVNANANANANGGDAEAAGPNGRDSSYQRYDIQHAARWLEQILPFSLLLLLVFIRQHLQGPFSIRIPSSSASLTSQLQC